MTDLIMTIEDDMVVPNFDAGIDDLPGPSQHSAKTKKAGKSKTAREPHPESSNENVEASDMCDDFVIDLDADNLQNVHHSLDFAMAKRSLRRQRQSGNYTNLEQRIAKHKSKLRRTARSAPDAESTQTEPSDKAKDREGSNEEAADTVETLTGNLSDSSDPDNQPDAASENDGSDEEQFFAAASDAEESSDLDQDAKPVAKATTKRHKKSPIDFKGLGFGSDSEDDAAEASDNSDIEQVPQSGSEASDAEAASEDEDEEKNDTSDAESEVDEQAEARKREYFGAIDTYTDVDLPESFNSMNLSRPIVKGLTQLGFTQPTAIQAKSIPVALLGKDICGGAVTGSGKTAAFVVPILERLLYRARSTAVTRVLVLCPTRELAIQCHNVAIKLAAFTDVHFCLCVGGLAIRPQEAELQKRPDVVIATPGRLIDHLRNSPSFSLDHLEILVMDEADRMLEDGFKAELTEIVKCCPRSRQTMLFSATMTDNVDELIRLSLDKPVLVQIDSAKKTARRLVQEFIRVRQNHEEDRPAILAALCAKTYRRKTIVFFRSKLAVREMRIVFGLLGLGATEIHGDLTQEQRLEALEMFRDGEVDYLMATDVAARGLDIKGVSTVINFNMPVKYSQYLHRVGRTARAGKGGRSVTLAGEEDRKILRLVMKNSPAENVRRRVIPPETIARYQDKIEKAKDSVAAILQEQQEDRELAKAEKEVNKAKNMIEFEAEIKARPAKTWFQTGAEKRQQKEASNLEYAAKFGGTKAVKPEKKTVSKHKKRKAVSQEDLAEQKSALKFIKSAKRANRPQRLSATNTIQRPSSMAGTQGAGKKKNKSRGGLDVGFTEDLTSTRKQGNGRQTTNAAGTKGKAAKGKRR
ncbi:nucleolar DEAD-box protein required for synthesis of 60S ribosomal subunit [Dimargaris verticillata]|uniref:RNA helicase n=1 Tax=Dimargaris verticillata TaxID=2761393 RepID=A0A9W8B2H0_9FUNG|nr:nucleolar DEAD-box protein required for synthesis of 60S ribosomal subunit [Dimargaris verticillata]